MLQGGVASAAAPTDVSADGDAVRAWHLRNGAHAVQVTAAGALIPGDATVGLRVAASGGLVAHDAADAGNPIKIGGKARTSLASPVAAADRADAASDEYGRMLVAQFPLAMHKSVHLTYTTAQTGTTVIDPTAGTRIAVLAVTITTTSTTAGKITLWFGANGDTTYSQATDKAVEVVYVIPSATISPGLSKTYQVPVTSVAADDELHVTSSAAVNFDLVVHYVEFT